MLASAPERPWRDPGSQARQESRFSVSALLTSKAPFEVVDDSSFRADDQAQHQVVDVFNSITAFPQKGGLKRHLLHEWQRNANPNSVFVPPTVLVVNGFVCGERFPPLALDREGMRDH